MTGERLTLSTVKALRYDPAGPRTQIVWDTELPGLGVRLYASGQRSWVCFYRVGRGRAATQRRHVLGSIAKLTPDQARNGDKARGILGAKEIQAAALNGVDLVSDKAQALEAQREAEERQEVEGLTFADVAAMYVKRGRQKLAETTWEDRSAMLRAATETEEAGALIRAFGARKVSEIGERDLRAWWAAEIEHADGLSQSAGRNRLAALTAVFVYATEELELAVQNPVPPFRAWLRGRSKTKADRANVDPTRTILPLETAEEIERLVQASAAQGDPSSHLLVLLMLDAGLRIGEALGLRWGDITFGESDSDPKRSLHIRQARARGRFIGTPKSGRSRVVALSRRLRKALLERQLAAGRPAPDQAVLPHADPANFVHRHWSRTCVAAKLGHRRPKDCRDSFASHLLSAGVQLGYISRQLGHSSVAITATSYARWCGGDTYRAPIALEPGELPCDLLARLPKASETSDLQTVQAAS